MPIATMANDGGLSDIANLLSLVKDQKTTTTTGTNISKEGVQQQINDILQGTSGLAAVAGAQHSAGLYNSSTNTQLTNDLLARASAQVAAKNATTTQTTSKKASVSKANIESLIASQGLKKILGSDTVKGGANSVVGSIADELGISYGANNTATDAALSSVSGAGPGAQVGDFTSLESSLASGTDINAGSSIAESLAGGGASNAATDAAIAGAGSGSGTDAAGFAALDSAAYGSTQAAEIASFDSGAQAGVQGAAADFFGDTAGEAAADGAGAGAGEAALVSGGEDAALTAGAADAGLGAAGAESSLATLGPYGLAAAAALYVGTKYGSQIDDNLIQPISDHIGNTISDGTNGIKDLLNGNVGDSIDDGVKAVGDAAKWIVCTELLRQGKFNKKHYAAGLKVFESYPKHLLCGYYVWATPLVAALRRNPSSWYSGIVRHVFAQRAEYLAARAGVFGAHDTVYSQCISAMMFGICWLLGHALNATAKTNRRIA